MFKLELLLYLTHIPHIIFRLVLKQKCLFSGDISWKKDFVCSYLFHSWKFAWCSCGGRSKDLLLLNVCVQDEFRDQSAVFGGFVASG